jgi:hypothetical protein
MEVTFQPNAWQREQLIWFCSRAGMDFEFDEVSGILLCRFDGAADLIAWHPAFVQGFDWSPIDIDITVSESEGAF